MSGKFIEDVDYKAVCKQLQYENEGLRESLGRLHRFEDTIEDVRHFYCLIVQTFKKNPYLLVVTCYVIVTLLDFIVRRTNRER